MNLSLKVGLKTGQILVITNQGNAVIDSTDWDAYCEDQEVYYGEDGYTFEIYAVITADNDSMSLQTADAYYSKREELCSCGSGRPHNQCIHL